MQEENMLPITRTKLLPKRAFLTGLLRIRNPMSAPAKMFPNMLHSTQNRVLNTSPNHNPNLSIKSRPEAHR